MSDIVRTFRAPDPRSALDAVKAALGAEAVILETREVGGGMWSRPEIEVTAMRSMPDPLPTAPGGSDSSLHTEVAALRRVVDDLRGKLSHAGAEPGSNVSFLNGPSIPPDAIRVCRQMVRRGVDSHLAEEIVQEALADKTRTRATNLEESIRALVARRLNGARPPWERNGRQVLALVGPTGVGKTTTIAKIAARALLESRLKVALITVDTYRIGASDHLARYSEIMGVKMQVARDATQLAGAVARSSDADLVLIDTAGRSDPDAIANQMGLVRSVPEVETHLVLSAASGTREIAAGARRYRELGVNRLIFSKLDEADGPGSVLSATAVLPRPISCLTNGQRVPDDLHPGIGPVLVDQVVGPARNKESSPWTKPRV